VVIALVGPNEWSPIVLRTQKIQYIYVGCVGSCGQGSSALIEAVRSSVGSLDGVSDLMA
jgi:hypothetical protein